MKDLLHRHRLVLMEAAIVEPIRRAGRVDLHPTLVNAPLIYGEEGREALRALYERYIAIAAAASLPLLICTPTWRASRERVGAAAVPESINRDAVLFLQGIPKAGDVRIGGLIGCGNDCYRPEEGLSREEARTFHAWQIGELAEGGVDYLIAETICTLAEAEGVALAMAATGLPCILSFVIRRDGCILDGTGLRDAIQAVDNVTDGQLQGFMVNCAWPGFLDTAEVPPRLIGVQANGSSLDHDQLDGATELQMEPVPVWGEAMLRLNREQGVTILGGCCGTGPKHLEYIARHGRGERH